MRQNKNKPASDRVEHRHDGPPRPAKTGTPPPGTSQAEIALQRAGVDYSSQIVAPQYEPSFLVPVWWSLSDAAEFIETKADLTSSSLTPGLERLEQAIRTGEVDAYGSVDAAPVTKLSKEAWTEFEIAPLFTGKDEDGRLLYDVQVRSTRSFRSSALHDHSYPSQQKVPSANFPNGELGYHRVVSNVFVSADQAQEKFSVKAAKKREDGFAGLRKPELIAVLEKITIGGSRVYPQRGTYSYAKITSRVVRFIHDEDTDAKRPLRAFREPTLAQAIRRIYLDQD